MREIQSQDWGKFCQRLNQFETGATVDLHWIDRSTKVQNELAHAARFQEITFGKRDKCNDQITIRTDGEPGHGGQHEIISPIHILLREVGNGEGFNAIAVEAEEGIMIMALHPAIRPAWLKGLQL
jgi:hypothetical protein